MGIFKCKEFEYGTDRRTLSQRKKHIIQMSDFEKDLTKKVVKNINLRRLVISPHLYEKMEKQGITFSLDIIYDTIKHFDVRENLIEVNRNNDKSTRILLRSRKILDVNVNGRIEKCKLCFVINLDNGHIVTTYWNTLQNTKRIPNLSNYDKNLNIINHLKKHINNR